MLPIMQAYDSVWENASDEVSDRTYQVLYQVLYHSLIDEVKDEVLSAIDSLDLPYFSHVRPRHMRRIVRANGQ